MRYFDTSFLVPLILLEATSQPISEFFRKLPVGEWAVSHWTRVEFASLLAREVRMSNLDHSAASEAGLRFETLVAESFEVFLPDRSDFDLARTWLGQFGTSLRAGDALHLGIAANRGVEAIYSLDKVMIAAGGTLGLPVGRADIPG